MLFVYNISTIVSEIIYMKPLIKFLQKNLLEFFQKL